ncbi:hypothetical protein NPIL_103861 [Nephila pilipes]|uniref:Uncharacterized protein n=1 Tax=Nephila pilipes TaxID=299642 RepID=A0A8X6MTE7_NEPPI|nr:hypothetical protein NPIL_103861 [Nephila pilipes]
MVCLIKEGVKRGRSGVASSVGSSSTSISGGWSSIVAECHLFLAVFTDSEAKFAPLFGGREEYFALAFEVLEFVLMVSTLILSKKKERDSP